MVLETKENKGCVLHCNASSRVLVEASVLEEKKIEVFNNI